jgi:hypothetical protein
MFTGLIAKRADKTGKLDAVAVELHLVHPLIAL